MKMLNRKIWRFAAAGLLLAAAGCMSNRGKDDALKIGVVLPLSGENAVYGKEILNGIECANSYLRDISPTGTKLPELIVVDDRSRSAEAAKAIPKLYDAGVAAVLVGYTSEEALAVKGEALRLQLPVMTPAGSNDKITERNPYMFRTNFSDRQQARALAYYAYYPRGCRRMASLLNLDENAIYARDLGRQTAQAFVDSGGALVFSGGFRENQTDFRPLLRELLAGMPDVVFVPAFPEAAGRIIRQLRELGYRGLILGGDSWSGEKLLKECGPDAAPASFTVPFAPGGDSKEEKAFCELYRLMYRNEPTNNAALGYDALMLTYHATRDTVYSEEVLSRFRLLRSFRGAAGELAVLPEGDVRRPVVIQQVVSDGTGKMKFRTERRISPDRIDREAEPVNKKVNNGLFN